MPEPADKQQIVESSYEALRAIMADKKVDPLVRKSTAVYLIESLDRREREMARMY